MDEQDKERLKNKLLDNSLLLENGCWEWQGCCGSHGYGQMTFMLKGMVTHRASHEVFKGPIPEGKMVCHICDYRRCINPEHLFIGTARDNIHDMIAKGRGDLQNSLKLTDDQARQIKDLYNKRQISQQAIAQQFDTSQATVSRIGTGASYWWI